jgi:hypothetical protein
MIRDGGAYAVEMRRVSDNSGHCLGLNQSACLIPAVVSPLIQHGLV